MIYNDEWKLNHGFKIIRMNLSKNRIETLSILYEGDWWGPLETFVSYKAMYDRFCALLADDHTLQDSPINKN